MCLKSHSYQTPSRVSYSLRDLSELFTLLSEHPSLCFIFLFLLLPTIKIHLSKAAPSLTISRSCRWLNKLIDGMPDWRFPPQPTPFSEWIWTYPHFYLTNATLLLSSSSSCRCVPRHESGLKLIPPAVGFRATLQEFSFYFFLSSPFGGVSHTLFTL